MDTYSSLHRSSISNFGTYSGLILCYVEVNGPSFYLCSSSEEFELVNQPFSAAYSFSGNCIGYKKSIDQYCPEEHILTTGS